MNFIPKTYFHIVKLIFAFLFAFSTCSTEKILHNKNSTIEKNQNYCNYLKRIDFNLLLVEKSFKFKLNKNLLAALNLSAQKQQQQHSNDLQEEIIYNFSQNTHSNRIRPQSDLMLNEALNNDLNVDLYFDDQATKHLLTSSGKKLFKFQIINQDSIRIVLENINVNTFKHLANHTIKFEFSSKSSRMKSKCSLLVDFYDQTSVPECDQVEFSSKYLNATFINYETFKSDSNTLQLDLKDYLPDILGDNQRYSMVCLKCSSHLKFKINGDLLEIKSSESFLGASEHTCDHVDIGLLIQKELNSDYDDNFLSKNFYLNVRIYANLNRTFVSSLNEEEKRSKRYLLHKNYALNGNDIQANSNNNNNNSAIVSKSHLIQGGYVTLKTAQLVINEETIGLQTRLKIYDHVWIDYQLNASDYVKQRIQLIAPNNPILNITKPFDFETGGSEHTFQIIFTRKSDKRTSNLLYNKNVG
jgi:hypothetical protein